MMREKNRIPKDANPEFKQVMKGVRGNNPEHKAQLKREAAKAKAVEKAIAKRKGKHTKRKGDGGDVIDWGMFR